MFFTNEMVTLKTSFWSGDLWLVSLVFWNEFWYRLLIAEILYSVFSDGPHGFDELVPRNNPCIHSLPFIDSRAIGIEKKRFKFYLEEGKILNLNIFFLSLMIFNFFLPFHFSTRATYLLLNTSYKTEVTRMLKTMLDGHHW